MGCVLSRVAGCKDWSRTAAGLPWVTARAACSGSTLGSVRMAVVVLRRRSELRTTEGNDRHRLHKFFERTRNHSVAVFRNLGLDVS